MLFHKFASQEERRAYGGSAFVEIQFCRLLTGTPHEEIVSAGSIEHWDNDSLYVDDERRFYSEYSGILDCGIYNDMNIGTVDIFGINYYAPPVIETIIERLRKERPVDHETFIEWLTEAQKYNGFYILGI